MSEKATVKAFIDGYEIDARTAKMLMDVTIPSVTRVVEESVIAGKSDDFVKAAAKTTAEAVVGTIVDLLKARIKPTSQE
ncbi:TPA: hypothetical protein ACNV5T_005920 [Klebsiella michiganensis]